MFMSYVCYELWNISLQIVCTKETQEKSSHWATFALNGT